MVNGVQRHLDSFEFICELVIFDEQLFETPSHRHSPTMGLSCRTSRGSAIGR